MVDHRVLVDLTHMSDRSLADTFALLDERDPDRTLPVIATHMACRLGKLGYTFTDETIGKVAERHGVLGVIDCKHFVTDRDGGPAPDDSLEDSINLICAQIDRVAAVTGSFDHAAIGTDLDGFIKPALTGLEHSGKMKILQARLADRYGSERANKVCSENALRVLRGMFAGRV